MSSATDNVIRLYDVRPEMALEHLKRSTGLSFDNPPSSLASLVRKQEVVQVAECDVAPPVLVDVVDEPVFKKEGMG